jgi:hypothetical protein
MTAATLAPQLPASPQMATDSLQNPDPRTQLGFIQFAITTAQATSIAICVTLGSCFEPMFLTPALTS